MALPFQESDVIVLECLGANAAEDGFRFLDGRTGNGTVGLAAQTGGVFTGTRWKVIGLGQDLFGFECQGNVPGPRFLDGRTGDGTVGLAPQTGGVFSGTKWKVEDLGENNVRLECRGDREGPRLLDGVTKPGTVRLTKDKTFTGTRWEVKRV